MPNPPGVPLLKDALMVPSNKRLVIQSVHYVVAGVPAQGATYQVVITTNIFNVNSMLGVGVLTTDGQTPFPSLASSEVFYAGREQK
jgi:hypothetical protein